MKRLVSGLVLTLVFITIILFACPNSSQASPGSSLILYSPAACPSGGCAAGQRLNFQASYDLGVFEPGSGPNVQFCLYTPIAWSASQLRIDARGGVTGALYTTSITYCNETAPAGYTLLGGAYAGLDSPVFGDSLGFTFRIGDTAIAPGSVLVRVMEQSGAAWTRTQQSFLSIPVAPTAATVFVANDAAACSINTPCYINSGDDLPDGLGTALKDAIDARAGLPTGSIVILGNYTIKSQSVLVDKPVTISGINDASLTYSGQVCSQPMLNVTAGARLRNLNVNDGNCHPASRDLIVINSPNDVVIESSDLFNGANAITVADNAGNLLLRFNNLRGNAGYAVQMAAGSGAGRLEALANNLYGNRTGAQVECNQKGRVDHNFWNSESAAASNCSSTAGKRLGAAILSNPFNPGVQASQFSVTGTKNSAFDGQISFQHGASGADFTLYVVNHGYSSPDSIPFTGSATVLTPCSNYWDVFLPDGTAPDSTLDLFFKYNLDASCTSTIESSSYCGQADQTLLPLYWYDPVANLTNGWSTTAKSLGDNEGQDTACLAESDELRVSIDSSGRPNLANDLHFLPFVAGIPVQNASVMWGNFTNRSSESTILLLWDTYSEYNIQSFYVQRYIDSSKGFQRISDTPILSKGSPQSSASYEFSDTGLTDGVTYRYRIEAITASQQTLYSRELYATAGVPTATPTATATSTATATATLTPTITRTPTITLTPTRTRTPLPTYTPWQPAPTWTRTPRPSLYRTSTPFITATTFKTPNSLTKTSSARTSTAISQYTPPGYPGPSGTGVNQTPGNYPGPGGTPGAGTETPTLQGTGELFLTRTATERSFVTSTPTLTPTSQAGAGEKPGPRGPWLPILIILSGLAAVTAVLWYLWSHDILKLPFLPFRAKESSDETAGEEQEEENDDSSPTSNE